MPLAGDVWVSCQVWCLSAKKGFDFSHIFLDNIYLRALKAKYVTYGNLSCLDVITSLNSTYYKIPPAALKDNSAHMTSAYYVSQLL